MGKEKGGTMSKRFCFIMFLCFVSLTLTGFYLRLPAGTFASLFMAGLYLAKFINMEEQ